MGARVIGTVGPQGSGKTEVAKILESLGNPVVRMGDAVWEETRRRGLEVNEENVGRVAEDLRRVHGPAAVARLCIPIVEERRRTARGVVIDGIRSGKEVEEFRRAFGMDFRLIAVHADREVRFSRVTSRGREDDVRDEAEFEMKERREMGWGLGEAMDMADFSINNSGSLEDLRRRVEEIYPKLMGRGVRVRVEAEVRPTESQNKVEQAIRKVFPDLRLGMSGGRMAGGSGDIDSLSNLRRMLRQQAILDAARSIMISNLTENRTSFMINKQVAYVGRVSFTDGESPLGPITVTLEAEDPERLIDYLAPRTEGGKPVAEIEYL